jgi:hypothetical protein
MRVTINKAHDGYISAIASQMGTTQQEALNYLLWELRRSNFQFGSQLPQHHQPQFDLSTYEQATAMSGLSFIPQSPQAIQEFESVQELSEEIDPIIAKMALLVDDF